MKPCTRVLFFIDTRVVLITDGERVDIPLVEALVALRGTIASCDY